MCVTQDNRGAKWNARSLEAVTPETTLEVASQVHWIYGHLSGCNSPRAPTGMRWCNAWPNAGFSFHRAERWSRVAQCVQCCR
jgi:hypothetical protein